MTTHQQPATTGAPQASTYLPTQTRRQHPHKDQLQAIRDAGGWISIDSELVAKFLQRVIDSGDTFTPEEAKADLIYWMDKRMLKPRSYYAKRWKWHRMKVSRFFKTLNLGCDRSVQSVCSDVTEHADSDSDNSDFVTEVCSDVTEVCAYIQTIPDHTQTILEKELLPSKGSALSTTPKVTADHIAAIYAAYPRKVAKSKALKSIKKALLSVPYETLLASVHQFAVSVAGKDPQFTPYPASWFNAERWLDDPISQTNNTSTATPTPTGRTGEGHTSLSQQSKDYLLRCQQRQLDDQARYAAAGAMAVAAKAAASLPAFAQDDASTNELTLIHPAPQNDAYGDSIANIPIDDLKRAS